MITHQRKTLFLPPEMDTSVWLSGKAFIAHSRWWFSSVVAGINFGQFVDYVAQCKIMYTQ